MVKNDFKILENNTVEVYYKSYIALFDLEDFNRFNQSRIYFSEHLQSSGKAYVILLTFKNGKKRIISRIILDENRKEKVVDHINGNTLDNRKLNLRVIDKRENNQNKFSYSNNNSSKISGVTYLKRKNIWVARIQVDGKRIFLGSSKDFEKTVSLRKQAEKRYFNDIKKH